MNPKMRETGILIHEVEGEFVVYDKGRKRAHRLNETAGKVWRQLNGERTIREIAADLQLDESVVQLAIDDLASAQLLESAEKLSVSRRSALRRVASAAAVGLLLPAVTSITAPTAAEAMSSGSKVKKDKDKKKKKK